MSCELVETEASGGFGRRMDWSYGLCLLQASTLTTLHPQRLSPGSALTGADTDPDLHSHFQSHFARLLLYITHIRTLNGHIGHTFTCWSFADQGGMQVAEDKLL